MRPKIKYCLLPLQRPTLWNCSDPKQLLLFSKQYLCYLFLDEKVTTVEIDYKNDSDFADSQQKIKEQYSLFKVCEDVCKLFMDLKYVTPSIKNK